MGPWVSISTIARRRCFLLVECKLFIWGIVKPGVDLALSSLFDYIPPRKVVTTGGIVNAPVYIRKSYTTEQSVPAQAVERHIAYMVIMSGPSKIRIGRGVWSGSSSI